MGRNLASLRKGHGGKDKQGLRRFSIRFKGHLQLHCRHGAEPVIKPRMNSTCKSRRSYVRAQTVMEFLSDAQAWKKKHKYGQRWRVETVFYPLKRMVGEYFTSVLNVGIYNEIMSKVFTYNMANRNGGRL
ncbi:MAG: transposase [Nitrososphaeria archaeon]